MIERLENGFNSILSRMWLGNNRLVHGISDAVYEIIYFFIFKIPRYLNRSWREAALKEIDICYPDCDRAQKREYMKYIRGNWMRYGLLPQVSLSIKRNGAASPATSFVSDTDRRKYAIILNDRKYAKLFRHKYDCWLKYQQFYKREIIRAGEWKENTAFFERHPLFFYKPEDMGFGIGAQAVKVSDYKNIEDMMGSLPDIRNSLCEELIVQHPDMARIHEASVNTIRIATVIGNDGKIRFYDPTLRCGSGGACIDNVSSGGICANIDIETGRILTDGIMRNGSKYECHPDSGIRFKGYQIPEWESFKEQLRQQAAVLPRVRYVGWDMALTADRGWVMVEANYYAQHTCQHADVTGRKEKFERLIRGEDR